MPIQADELAGRFGVLVVAHPRSGTHLTIDVIRRHFSTLANVKPLLAPLDALYVSLDALLIEDRSSAACRRAITGLRRHEVPVIKSHWLDVTGDNLRCREPVVADWINRAAKKIYVVRHPSSVMSSLYEIGRAHV